MMVKKMKKMLSQITAHWQWIFNYEMGNICSISWYGKARCGTWNFVTGQPWHSSAVNTYSSKWCTDTQLLIQFNIMQFPPKKKF